VIVLDDAVREAHDEVVSFLLNKIIKRSIFLVSVQDRFIRKIQQSFIKKKNCLGI
jgi:hypothetical protein